MGNLKIWKSVLLLNLNVICSLTKVFTEHRSEFFELNSRVTLDCTNVTLASILFTTWTLNFDGKQCRMAYSPEQPKFDSCHDGKILHNNTNGETYLEIPHFTKRDEGSYQCETIFQGGSRTVVMHVSAKVPLEISTKLDLDHREAVCAASGVKADVSISWRTSWNTTVTNSSVLNSDGSYTIESQLTLPDHVHSTKLECIVMHPTWRKNVIRTIQVPKISLQTWQLSLICAILVCFLMGVLAGLYIVRKHLRRIRNCCKFNISTPPPQTTAKDEDVLEAYATYVQRVNSIYNSSADLFHA